MYLFSATEENILLKQIRAKGITFFIQNTNSSKMYVTQGEGEDFELKEGKYEIEESQHVDTKEKYGYFLKDGVLVEKIKGIKKLLNNDSVAIYANMLNRKIIQNKEKKNTKILHAIRYGIRIEEYNNTIHEKLLDIYNIDETIKGYLNICLEKGYIKSEVLQALRRNEE